MMEENIKKIIEECNGNMLDERETYWGNHYDVLGENGLKNERGLSTPLPF